METHVNLSLQQSNVRVGDVMEVVANDEEERKLLRRLDG